MEEETNRFICFLPILNIIKSHKCQNGHRVYQYLVDISARSTSIEEVEVIIVNRNAEVEITLWCSNLLRSVKK